MTEAEHSESTAPGRKRRFNVELFSAGMAIILSLLSIVVAYRSELTQREMLAASVWPHLQFDHGNIGDDGIERISFQLRNVGTGPAQVVNFQLFDDDRAVPTTGQLLSCCVDWESLDPRNLAVVSSPIDQPVLPANEGLTFFRIDRERADQSLWQALDQRRFQMWAKVCYCSVLNDCWELDSRDGDNRVVAACAADAKAGFNKPRR